MQKISETLKFSLIPIKSSSAFGIAKTEQIYEVWTLFKMIHILTTTMGWELKDKERIVKEIEDIVIPKKKKVLEDFEVTLSLRDWSIVLSYEPIIEIYKDKHTYKKGEKKPDYVFKIYHKKEFKGIAYLDAKHRNYIEQGEKTWAEDIRVHAIERYGEMLPTNMEYRNKLLGVFLIHSDIEFGKSKDLSGENYYAYYNEKYFPNKLTNNNKTAHQYGSIYLLPSVTHVFANWFRMIMEYKIGMHEVCWKCGNHDIKKEKEFTTSNFPKYYYTCNNCNEFWVKTHCKNKKNNHKLVKHFDNYHRQVKRYNEWYTVCPVCGNGSKKKDKNYLLESYYKNYD